MPGLVDGLGVSGEDEQWRSVGSSVRAPASAPAIAVRDLCHRYGPREALRGVTFSVGRGELFGLLGPNGGGKSTLFRILATLLRPTAGTACVLGHDVTSDAEAVRRHLGIVFQHPSLDPLLTVEENLRYHGRLYGLRGAALAARITALLARFGLVERRRERVARLSGGLARRVEVAKGLLPQPAILLLDEPSAGLDPAARQDLLGYLIDLRRREGVTLLLTTHHLDEAERCDRLAILDRGALVALDAPDALKSAVGGDVVVVRGEDPEGLRALIRERFGLVAAMVDGTLRLEHARGHEIARDLVEAFGRRVSSVTFGRPTLADVFVHFTGRRFTGAVEDVLP